MNKKAWIKFKVQNLYIVFLLGVAVTITVLLLSKSAINYTSTDQYCFSCHVHDHAEESWRLSPHVNNNSGVVVHCVDCHLPPEGEGRIWAKAKHGAKDVYGMWFKDTDAINWEAKRTTTEAEKFTYEKSCLKCHSNLFPNSLSVKGEDSHLYYESKKDEMTCLNCHSFIGHYNPNALHAHNLDFATSDSAKAIFTEATPVTAFKNFTENIPGTSVSFNMVAIPGGEFKLGSPKNEKMRQENEGPLRKVKLNDFFMAEIEVSWEEYLAFFNETASEGRKETTKETEDTEVDAITGATPPWGAPDQGWGKGSRPAITMSHHAAEVYCKWLSKVTGKKYRLPTEAEWEYAARAGSSGAYFFEGKASDYSKKSTWNKVFGVDTAIIGRYVVYDANNPGKTQEPESVKANAFGLKNMLGNVHEFCADYYAPDAYKIYKEQVTLNPTGPAKGREHVIRGGSFKSDASEVRCASRKSTETKKWLQTDPQMPKSIWWYSDCIDVGFRVVCEVELEESK